MPLQAWRTLQRAFILHTREREGRFRETKLKISTSMGEGQSKIQTKNLRERRIKLVRFWKNTDIASVLRAKDELYFDCNYSSYADVDTC